MNIYNHILQGHEATIDNAYEHAMGIDWQSIETTYNDSLPYLQYIDTVNGVDIWNVYADGSYIFSDASDE